MAVTLFDQFGRPIAPREARTPERREVAAVSLRDRWSNYPADGLTPGRLARILKQADAGDVVAQAELFEQMEERDAHLGSQFQLRKLAVQGLDWEVVPAGEDQRAADVAAQCATAIGALPDFEDNILDMLDALAKGYSLTEILWDVSSGQALPHSLRWVHPRRVSFATSLTPRVLTEAEPARGEDLAPFKWVYHRYKARSGYDTRAGIMRVCAWMYLFKNYGVKDWVAFAEVYGQPLRLGKYSPNASREDKDALKLAVASLGTDAAGIISKATEIEFVEASKTSSLNVYESLVRFCDAQMSKAVLGQVLTSEAGGQHGEGSQALGRVHSDVRQDLVEADCKALGKTLTRDLLRPLVGFNFGWDTACPAFRLHFDPPEDMLAQVQVLDILTTRVGMDVAQEWVSRRFRVPMRQAGETPLLRPAQGAQSFKRLALKDTPEAGHPAALGAARALDAEPLAAWGEVIGAELERCASLVEFRDRLEGLVVSLDPGPQAALLRQAMTMAELAGRFDANER